MNPLILDGRNHQLFLEYGSSIRCVFTLPHRSLSSRLVRDVIMRYMVDLIAIGWFPFEDSSHQLIRKLFALLLVICIDLNMAMCHTKGMYMGVYDNNQQE